MMGGFGSGRPGGFGCDTVESCRSLDVNKLNRAGCLAPGWSGAWQWTRDGKQVAWITIRAEGNGLNLSYRWRIAGGEWQDVSEPVPIVRVPCQFGGGRPFFVCPGAVNSVSCARRVAKLYGAGRCFLCRHCYRLAYSSQREDAWGRALRRGDKIRRRLGGDPGAMAPLPEKPRGMWWRTYERLYEAAFEAKTQADAAFVVRGRSLLTKIDRQKRKSGIWR